MTPTEGFETLAVTREYDGKMLHVDRMEVRAPDGSTIVREMIVHPGSVMALPLADDGTVTLIRQMRTSVGRELLEAPAGLLDEAGEAPERAAARECEEEVGLRPGRMTLLAAFYATPGYSDEYSRLYLAEDLEPVAARPGSAEERSAQIVALPLAEALAMVAAGGIIDAKTMLALHLCAARLRRG